MVSEDSEKRLGRIARVKFGLGGYQDAMLGLHVTIEGAGWGTVSTRSAWDKNIIKHSDYCKWTEEERSKQYVDIMGYVSDLLKSAKVDTIDRLQGIPVEATFVGMTLKEWRILTEVL